MGKANVHVDRDSVEILSKHDIAGPDESDASHFAAVQEPKVDVTSKSCRFLRQRLL
jgi:hypothetical protein